MLFKFRGRTYNISRSFPEPYAFEKWVVNDDYEELLKDNWHYSLYISVAYIILIFSLLCFMKSRPPINTTRWMAVWNGILALFSICCVFRGIELSIWVFSEFSFTFIACNAALVRAVPSIIFWGTIFLFLKIAELSETVFIILGKRKIMFLHCYHHAATVVLVWYLTAKEISALIVIGYVNTIVHSMMYTYFFFKSLGFKVPRFIAAIITTTQILQMISGVLVSVSAYWVMREEKQCDSSPDPLVYAFYIYLTYTLLFLHLFYTSYIKPKVIGKKKL